MDPKACDDIMAILIRIERDERMAREAWAFVNRVVARCAHTIARGASAIDRLFGAFVTGLREPKDAGWVTE